MKRSILLRVKIKVFRLMESCCRRMAYQRYLDFFEERRRTTLGHIKEKRFLTQEQREEITEYYKRLTGKTISLSDHEYFYARTGIYSKQYMPVGYYEAEIVGRANRLDCYNSYADKNLDEILLPQANHPRTILKNVNGYFYYEGRPVSRQEAALQCRNVENAIIKPSLATKGRGVKKITIADGMVNPDGTPIEKVFDMYGKDFLIQEAVQQHADMSRLNPSSVNTLRILTYRSGMDVLVVYTVVRIGRKGQVMDNQSAGGLSARINSDGTIGKFAYGSVGEDHITHTDTGVLLEGYAIPSFDKAVGVVKQLHYSLPLFDLIGWDIAIRADGEPVLIEWNGDPGPSQTACGTGFGALTDRIISEVLPRENSLKFDKFII